MGVRHPNPRRVKAHGNYSVEEVARLFGLHEITFRQTAYLESLIAKRDKEASGEQGP
jgi:hypothetical protein